MSIKTLSILLCAGTRPNFVKIAPLYHEAKKQGVAVKILHTGQHHDYNLNQIFFTQLGLPTPNINLEIPSGPRLEYVQNIAKSTAKYISNEHFDYVITVGDVNSTLGCTLGGKMANVPVAHVEAGLRSHDSRMPEDANRVEVDKLADYKFISEPDGVINLKLAGLFNPKTCFLVGNVMIDSLVNNMINVDKVTLSANLQLPVKSYCIVTLHRPSNVDEKLRLKRILKFLDGISSKIQVVFPLHPRTLVSVEKYSYQNLLKHLIVTEPLGYFEFLHMLKNSKFAITDSGGAQEESSFLNVPCITLRANTERPVTILHGTSVLAGEDIRLLKYFTQLALEDRLNRKSSIDLWDGKASERIINILKKL